ncbi:MAG: nucleotidyltransferase domain-containing protein [Candidatus Nezhaarchaeota archaeon]|nr:nucleotidyltransferase domain-containing protein [Candidatus Nezhaarchaeota archaeon]
MLLNSHYKYYRLKPEEREALIEGVRRVLEEEGVVLAIVFGSFTELDSFRDIDIAVYTERAEAGLDAISKLAARLEEQIHVPVDVVPLESIPTKFRRYILTKGRVILERVAGLYEALVAQTVDELMLLERSEGRVSQQS